MSRFYICRDAKPLTMAQKQASLDRRTTQKRAKGKRPLIVLAS